ncbi:hypothetical protein BD626DRAFT_569266 [Schizophyllum amplum]|uniref:Uncharacterized protein n=1 Tax=Schizophyllum amplum TaxID=97359 RepID=A0A550CEK6_9AGAR|nr:hypothetical protein BD626DRAFT_569266 [Auriculariopsis ampla]
MQQDVKADVGARATSLYDLVDLFDEDKDWYRFDDDKVSIIPKEKIATLDGGGEDPLACVLLRSLE